MRAELEQKIAETFPFMKREHSYEEQRENGRIYDLYGAFGCDVGDGWFSVIWGLCEDVTAAYRRAGKEIDFVPAQVKEKFGMLRFYYDVAGKKNSIHAFDCLGGASIRFQEDETPLYKEVAKIVRTWEEKSAHICEHCGNPGKLRSDLRRVLTLCDACHQKRSEKDWKNMKVICKRLETKGKIKPLSR